jgi:hypothetical protein
MSADPAIKKPQAMVCFRAISYADAATYTRYEATSAYLSSSIRTVPSAPESHRFSRDFSQVAGFTADRGISPRPEE